MMSLSRRSAVAVFLVFAFAYFLSTLIRAITATLSPNLTQEFALNARDLGLLAGGYFLGFAATQLPLGKWLDRHGPKKVILSLLAVAVAGCVLFSLATNFVSLLVARILCGVGVSACLMAPLTGYRRWLHPASLLRANSWMLMTGSLGMVAATLPIQWLMPLWGWRPLFWGLAAMVLMSMLLIYRRVPSWDGAEAQAVPAVPVQGSYADVWRHPYFRKLVPLGFFNYGGLVAIQTLWAVPWMIKAGDYTPVQAATGLFWINVMMLITFWAWGMINPWLVRRGLPAEHLIKLGVPASLVLLVIVILAAGTFAAWTGVLLGLFCMSCTFLALAQPAVGLAFAPELAGRALAAYNLVIFSGVFAVQWGIGLMVDGLEALGWKDVAAFQGAMGVYLVFCFASYLFFLVAKKT